jgi:hypothetical protein
MRSNRQQQIVRMVEGYDSTITVATALRNVFLVWVLYGLALLVFGLIAFASNPLSESAATSRQTLEAVLSGGALLLLVTFVASGAWVARSVANVRRLGRTAHIGVVSRIRQHILAFCFGFVAVMFAVFIPALAVVFLLTAIGLFFYSQLWFHLVVLDVVRMLWRSSSPPNGQHEDVDHYVLIWFWSWVLFFSCLTADLTNVDVSPRTFASLAIVGGVACVVAGILASRLVVEISKRQDARLFAIIREVDDEQYAPPVTDQDIAAAWNRSASMIDLPH